MLDPSFTYAEGNVADKRIICLSESSKQPSCVLVPVTKQQRQKLAVRGCHRTGSYFYIPAGESQCFEVNTWVQLDAADLMLSSTIERRLTSGSLRSICTIKRKLVDEIVLCALQCDDFNPLYPGFM